MQLLGLNTLDLLLLVVIFIGMLVGMFRGSVPQLISIVSIWLGLFATLWLYKLFSRNILQGLNMDPIISDTLSFLLILFVMFHAVRLVVKALSTPPEERKRKKKDKDDPLAEAPKTAMERFVIGPLNLIGGMVLGIILTILWTAIILGAVQFIFQPDVGELSSFARRMTAQMNASTLVPAFNQVLRGLSWSLNFFIPRNADIFRKVIEIIS